MNYFAQGFVQGLANQLSTDINTRRDEARNFFNKQVEMARTTGLQNRRRVRQAVEGNVSVARQLNQMGVPKDIIMAVANQDPESLPTFYEQITRAQAAGIQTDEQFFRDFVEVGEGFMAPDEDFHTFFTRMYDPVVSNAESNPDSFNEDKRGGIFASMFGLNAMERANEKLGETEIVDGMTAEQLLQYGDEIVPNKISDAPVTFNYNTLAERERATKGGDSLSISEINAINTRLEEITAGIIGPLQEEMQIDTEDPEQVAAFEAEAARRAREVILTEFGSVPGVSEYLDQRLGPVTEAPEPIVPTDAVAPPPEGLEAPAPTPVAETPTGAPESVSDAPIDPATEPYLVVIMDQESGRTLTLIRDNGDGTSRYMDQDGNEVDLENGVVRQLVGGSPTQATTAETIRLP